MKNFAERFLELSEKRSNFCLGIDPTPQLLSAWNLPDSAEGLRRMCRIIVEAAASELAVVKPQIAYFERFGAEGIRILISLIEEFRQKSTLVLVDAKRGDIGTTIEAYAQSILGAESALKGDAVTAHAYLGFESLLPLFKHAGETGTGVFVVVKSSNPEGEMIQDAVVRDGRTIAEYLADNITDFNGSQFEAHKVGAIGAVVGATLKDNIQALLRRLEKSLILAPGIGHQGASFEDLRANFGETISRVIPTSSRAVLKFGPDAEALNSQIKKICAEAVSINSAPKT